MSTVKKSTEAAASIQRNAMEEFKETSEVLNEKVIAMTTYIQRVTKEISSGLAAVSEGNRKMEFYIKRFSDAFDLLGALPDNVNRLTHEVSELCVRIDRQMSVQQPVEELVEA